MTLTLPTKATPAVVFEIVSHAKKHALGADLQLELATRLTAAGPREEVARALVDHFARQSLTLPDLEAVTAVTRVLSFLVSVFGWAGARQAIEASLRGGGGQHSSPLCVLSRTAGIPCGIRPDRRDGTRFNALVHEFSSRVRTGGVDLWDAACWLTGVPSVDLGELVAAILARVADHPHLWPYVACLLLGPGDEPVKVRTISWLGMHIGRQALPLLDRLTEESSGAEAMAAVRRERVRLDNAPHAERGPALVMAGLPFDWPIVGAYASTVEDGTWFYVARQQSDGHEALIGALVSRQRGISDATGEIKAPHAHLQDFLDGIDASPYRLRTVPPRVALTRIRQAIRTTTARELPLPYEFRAMRHILAGL